ncbi:MAG: hypothetical protein JXQ66_05500 [Campylobacterales bacterium]|nr:hypothetical protein [Campylobacterales bacterium]
MYFKVSILITLLFFSGCTKTANKNLHEDKSHHINGIMLHLYSEVNNPYKSELDLDDDKIRYAYSISQAIKEFAKESKNFSQKELGIYVSKNKELFEKNLNRLKNKAIEIEDIANRYEVEKLDKKLYELKNICYGCHSDLGVRNEKVF